MPPRKATESAWPVTRMVARKALATPSWVRSTLPMMALVLGALKAAMPRPTTARDPTTWARPAVRPRAPRRAMPAATSAMPEVARVREPMRSLSRPAKGLRRVIITGCPMSTHPATRAGWPRTSWSWTAVSTLTA